MREYKLKPCPFCGSKNVLLLTEKELKEDETKGDYMTVVCDLHRGGCGATSGFRQYEEDAVDAWNRRTL